MTPEQFGQLNESLSEPGGYFDSDNLISNESSYLHVLGKMRQMKVAGGAEFTDDVVAAGKSVSKHRHREQGDGELVSPPVW